MSLGHGPKIVRDGLIHSYDSFNKKCHSSGNIVSDMIGDLDGNFNGGTIHTNNLFEFDGVNSTINLGTGNDIFPLPNFSVECWFRSDGTTPVTGTSPGVWCFTYGVRMTISETRVAYGVDNGTSFTYIQSPTTYQFFDSSWHHTVCQATPTERHLYIDGEYISSLTDAWPGITRWPTNALNIGRDNNNVMLFFTGAIPMLNIYNKVLTAAEVQQNFNATKGRFGL